MLIYKRLLYSIIFLSLSLGQENNTENRYSRSVVNMDELLKMEESLVLNLENFTAVLSQKAKIIRWGIQKMEEMHHKLQTGSSEFCSSPFISYSLIRHMQADWLMWQEYLERPMGLEQLAFVSTNSTKPQEHDFFDAADGITRMQGTYQLLAGDIASGLLDGVQYNSSLAAVDCLKLARDLMEQSYLTSAEEWILAGIKVYDRPGVQREMHLLRGPNRAELYRTLGQVRMEQKNYEGALEAYQHDKQIFQEYYNLEREVLTSPETKPITSEQDAEDEVFVRAQLPLCCSGRCEVPRELRKLYCVYNHVTAPFLRLAPIKTEILSIDPFVVLLHDMISPNETALIRSSSKKSLLASAVYSVATKSLKVASSRFSKSVWWDNNFNEATQKISERLQKATGLDMNYTEPFQVINYGLGGFFEMHMDLKLSRKELSKGKPDRMATTIFYLSDVLQGGATFFPRLNLTVFPKFGSALFWYNFDSRGEQEIRTIHTGCPVIAGSKWVVSKWIEDVGQEFRRPCINSNSSTKDILSIETLII